MCSGLDKNSLEADAATTNAAENNVPSKP